MSDDNSAREENRKILDSYDGSDIYRPQVILRKVHEMDGNVLDDDLYKLEVNPYGDDVPYSELGEFTWAYNSLWEFKKQYRRMLEDPTERIHLQALAQSGCRIFIESLWSSSGGNGKSGTYGGMSTRVMGKPAILMVADMFPDNTLLHEAVHNSDLKLNELYMRNENFSAQKIHHAAIMMIDAQKISSFDGYDSVRACRRINKVYQEGELYIEGLAWITQMSMEELAREKNHIGKHLKVLHALYTDAVMKKQTAVMDCFCYWKPSEHIAKLLEKYDHNGQKIGKERNKILKQQKHFWDELLKFRKEINKLKTHGLDKMTLSADMIYICDKLGVNSHIPAYMAQNRAEKSYDRIEMTEGYNPAAAHVKNLKELFAEIKPNDLNSPSLFAEKFLACHAYFLQMEKDHIPQEYAKNMFGLSFNDRDLKGIAGRKKMYDNMKALISIAEIQAQTNSPNKECTLAYLFDTNPLNVNASFYLMRSKMSMENSFEDWRQVAEQTFAEPDKPLNRLLCVRAVEQLLNRSGLYSHIHGALQLADLRDFHVSRKIVDDLKWAKIGQNEDGLPLEMYKNFEPGIWAEYCSRSADEFNPESPNYKPNNYVSEEAHKMSHARALYEFLALRHAYQAASHCKKFPADLQLGSFRADSDYYRRIRMLAAPKTADNGKSAKNHENI